MGEYNLEKIISLPLKELFDSILLQTLKFARLLNRYRYFSNTLLKIYFSIGCVKPMKI